MAITLYVDGSVGFGNGDGTDTNPFGDLQDAVDSVIAQTGTGHTIYCRGTQYLNDANRSYLDFRSTQTGGDLPADRIKLVGCPADSWIPDGSRFSIDGTDSSANYGMDMYGLIKWDFYNIEVLNMSVGSGWYFSSQACSLLSNCAAKYNAQHGYTGGYCKSAWHKCVANYNGINGWDYLSYNRMYFSSAIGNGGIGLYTKDMYLGYGLFAANNGGDGFQFGSINNIANCLSYNNSGKGLNHSLTSGMLGAVGVRSINNGDTGIVSESLWTTVLSNCFLVANSGAEFVEGNFHIIDNLGLSGEAGLSDPDNFDFNMVSTAGMLNSQIIIPLS